MTAHHIGNYSDEKTMGTGATFAMWLGANVVVTTILTGMFLVPALSFTEAFWLVFGGSAVAIIPLIMIGVMGLRTGFATMVLSKVTFGRLGGRLPALVNMCSLVAWSWIQALLAGMSLNYAVHALTGFSSVPLFTVLCEALVVLIVLKGHKGIETTEKIAAVLMLLLAAAVFWALNRHYPIAVVFDLSAAGGMSVGGAFDIVVATAFSWIPLAADYNRHCKHLRAAVFGTWGGYVAATCIAMGLGATVSALSAYLNLELTYDPTRLLANFGFGLPAALVVFFSVLTTNVMCVYSATLSYLSIRNQSGFAKPAVIIGVISILGSLIPGILERFQDFLLVIGSIFIPAFALMIVDYFLLPERVAEYRKLYEQEHLLPAWRGRAFFCYCVGAVLAYYWNWVAPLAVGASAPVFLITGGLYWLVCRWWPERLPSQDSSGSLSV